MFTPPRWLFCLMVFAVGVHGHAADHGPMIVLKAPADLMDGTEVLARLPAGTRAYVLEVKQPWSLVKTPKIAAKGWLQIQAADYEIVGQAKGQKRTIKKAYLHFAQSKLLIEGDETDDAITEIQNGLQLERSVLGDHPDVAETLLLLGRQLVEKQDYVQAFGVFSEMLRIRAAYLGEYHPETATAACIVAMAAARSEQDDVETFRTRALAAASGEDGKPDITAASRLEELSGLAVEYDDLELAKSFLMRAVEIRSKVLGRDHLETVATEVALVDVLSNMGQLEQAIEVGEKALSSQVKVYGEMHVATASILNTLGNLNFNDGNFEDAETYYRRSLKVYIALFGEEHEDTATVLYNVGDVLRMSGQANEAIAYYKRALALRTDLLGADHAFTVDVLCGFGDAAVDAERYDLARDCYHRALKARTESDGEFSDGVALLLASLATVDYNEGNFEKALNDYQRVVDIRRQINGERSAETALALYDLGDVCNELGRYQDATAHLEQALPVQEKLLGNEHEETEATLCMLGDVASNAFQPDQALKWYHRALRSRVKSLGEDHIDTATLLRSIGDASYFAERFPEAKQYYERSLAVYLKLYGEKDEDTAYVLGQLGGVERSLVHISAARKLLNRALAIYRELDRDDEVDATNVIEELAQLEYSANNYEVADRLFRQALSIYEDDEEGNEVDSLWVLRRLGETQAFGFDDYESGRDYMERALRICLDEYGEQHMETATTLNEFGNIVFYGDDLAAADRFFSRALAIQESILEDDHVDIARTLENLGMLATRTSDYSTARQHHVRSLEIFENHFGEDDDNTASTRLSLADVAMYLGNFAEARKQATRTRAIHEKLHGEKSSHVADVLNQLGNIELFAENYSESEEHYRQALEIYESHFSKDSTTIATVLNNLGFMNLERGKPREAEEHLTRAYEIYRDRMGEEHSDTAMALENLAAVWRDIGQFDKARDAFLATRRIRAKLFGPDDPSVAYNLIAHAELDAITENETANQKFQQARRISRRYLANILPTLSSAEQMQFLAGDESRQFAKCLSYAFKHQESKRVALQSVGWLVNGKAIGQEALAEGSLLSRPETVEDVRRLRSVRSRLAQLGGALAGKIDEQKRRETIAILESEQRELQRKIAAAGTGLSLEDPWVSPGQLRDNIPSRSVMVQIVQFQPFDFRLPDPSDEGETRWEAPQYVAWIIPASGEGDVRIIRLGETAAIDALVEQVVNEITAPAGVLNQRQQRDASKRLRPKLKALAAKILDPLLPHVKEAKELILSPDGSLWLVPWAALPIDQDFAIDRYDLRYLVSGRELAQSPQRFTGVSAPVVVADPDYDLDPSTVASQDVEVPLGKPSPLMFAMRGSENIARAQRLPGTAREAELISPQLERYARQPPQVFLDRNASETQIKATYRPRVLVLSTHGFFFADQGSAVNSSREGNATARQALPRSSTGSVIGNPLLRCGLLLAGSNRRNQVDADRQDDGVLTGLEVVGIDLRGTELVVLSACETGRGDVRCGEGVAGLRQAFQFAGASAVAASLWKIPDDATVPLMLSFFQNLASGKSKSSALCEAQRTMIEHRRNTVGVAHPYYWAAFTLTGR